MTKAVGVEHESVRICSIRDVAEALGRPLAQVQLMSGANLLGQSYTTLSGATYHLETFISELACAPRLSRHDLLRELRLTFSQSPVVILRQSSPRRQESPVRSWYGYDRKADLSTDPAQRRAQDDASRMYWPISHRNQSLVREAAASASPIPLIISVGGWIASCREITGIDEELSALRGDQVAFTIKQAGDWSSTIVDRWLESGAGKAILWWHHS